MRRATRTNLVLAALVVALGLAAWWQIDRENAARPSPLTALDPNAIGTIAVRCAQCTPRRFERVDGRWWMREPYALAADAAALARLAAVARSPVRARLTPADYDLARLGLDPPQYTLQLDATRIDIGTTDALDGGDRYVRVGDALARVPDRFAPLLAAAPENELDRAPLPLDREPVAVTVDGVDRPDLIGAWRGARAERVVAASNGDAPPGARVELRLADGETLAFAWHRVDGGYVAERAMPAVGYVFDEAAAQRLLGRDP